MKKHQTKSGLLSASILFTVIVAAMALISLIEDANLF